MLFPVVTADPKEICLDVSDANKLLQLGFSGDNTHFVFLFEPNTSAPAAIRNAAVTKRRITLDDFAVALGLTISPTFSYLIGSSTHFASRCFPAPVVNLVRFADRIIVDSNHEAGNSGSVLGLTYDSAIALHGKLSALISDLQREKDGQLAVFGIVSPRDRQDGSV